MTNNTTHQDVIDLFPDNVDNNISAGDMRTAFNGVFNDRSETIIKLETLGDLPLSDIYEGTLIVVYSGADIGLWLSIINQPNSSSDLIKIA